MQMKERTFMASEYRFGFNGQEQDGELMDGAVSFKYRVHDPRIGKFLSVDPLAPEYPWNSSYAFAENRVIEAIDLEGKEALKVNEIENINGKTIIRLSTDDSVEGNLSVPFQVTFPNGTVHKQTENGDWDWGFQQLQKEMDDNFQISNNQITYRGESVDITKAQIDWNSTTPQKAHKDDYAIKIELDGPLTPNGYNTRTVTNTNLNSFGTLTVLPSDMNGINNINNYSMNMNAVPVVGTLVSRGVRGSNAFTVYIAGTTPGDATRTTFINNVVNSGQYNANQIIFSNTPIITPNAAIEIIATTVTTTTVNVSVIRE
jgi:RHS repeat-associated protein